MCNGVICEVLNTSNRKSFTSFLAWKVAFSSRSIWSERIRADQRHRLTFNGKSTGWVKLLWEGIEHTPRGGNLAKLATSALLFPLLLGVFCICSYFKPFISSTSNISCILFSLFGPKIVYVIYVWQSISRFDIIFSASISRYRIWRTRKYRKPFAKKKDKVKSNQKIEIIS